MPSDAPYLVGYKKPPRHTRFRKGQSGNPAGRPKGSLSLAKALEGALTEPVVVVERGERRTLSKFEVMLKQLVNKAAGGDLRAFAQVSALFNQVMPEDEEMATVKVAHEDDRQILANLLQRMKQQIRTEVDETSSLGATHEP